VLAERTPWDSKRDSPFLLGHNRRVRLWQVTYNPKTRGHTHATKPGFGHTLLGPAVTYVFRQLGVSASLLIDRTEWVPIHLVSSITTFEIEHGKDRERYAYNERHFARAHREKKAIRGEHVGFVDFFVPVVVGKDVATILVVGPVARARPTAADVSERWRRLTGRQGHPADPEFASYLSATLSTLTLEGTHLRVFERLLSCFARLLAGEGRADELMNQATALRAELEDARFPERSWAAVRAVVDDRTQRSSLGIGLANEMRHLGLGRRADHVLVGLSVSRSPEPDAVDEAIRRDGFQRSAPEIARAIGDAVAGQVGDYGVVLLSAASGSAQRKRQKLVDLADRVSALGRQRFGLSLHFGAAICGVTESLSGSYQQALGAAESALVQGERLVMAETAGKRPVHSLRQLHRELVAVVEEHPEQLGARFERYLQAVALQCGYRVEPAKAHIELGFERMTEGLVKSGVLDERSFQALGDGLDRAAAGASTMNELFAACRRAALDVVAAVQKPTSARRDRSLRGALDYIHQHCSEPLSRKKVARVAGFAPGYFSQLFKKRESMGFEHYVHGLRIERAKQLLLDTELDAARVAELSGFKTPQYFSRVFVRATGVTPIVFRTRSGKIARP
jgi:AraC-like DNA-binding protein